jgi:hypothetical protein
VVLQGGTVGWYCRVVKQGFCFEKKNYLLNKVTLFVAKTRRNFEELNDKGR